MDAYEEVIGAKQAVEEDSRETDTQDYLQNVASVTMSKVEMSERAYLSETKSVPFFRSGFSWYYVIGTGSAGFLQHYKRYFQYSG